MTMSTPTIDQCVRALVKDFSVEDIWVLEAAKARECGLSDKLQLVVFVSEGEEPDVIEVQALRSMREQFGDVGVHVFSHTAMFQIPRPLLVKMAFSSGRQVFSR